MFKIHNIKILIFMSIQHQIHVCVCVPLCVCVCVFMKKGSIKAKRLRPRKAIMLPCLKKYPVKFL